MKNYLMIGLLVLLAACGRGDINNSTNNQSGAPQSVQLQMNLKQGDTWTLTQEQTMHQTMEMMGEAQTIALTTTNNIASTVIEPTADGNARYTSIFESMIITQTVNGQTTTTDFSDPQAVGMSGQSSMVGKVLTTTIAPNGEIKDMTGFDSLMDDNPLMATMGKQLKDTFTKNPGVTTYPATPVTVGDSWTQSLDFPIMFMNTTIAMTYTVEQINAEHVEVSVIGGGVLSMDENALKEMTGASEEDLEGAEMSMNIDMTINGTMSIEIATGLVSQQAYTQTMKGNIIMGKQGEEPLEVPINMVQDMKVTLKR